MFGRFSGIMSTNSSSKRCARRNARDSNRAKMNLKVDLNSPPAEAAAQSSQPPAAVSIPAVERGGTGAVSAPIDVEASDDELQMLSSPRGFHQARNQSRRRNRPVIVVADEEWEIHSGTSGVRAADLINVSSVNRANKRQRIPPNRTVINCESYSISEDDPVGKRKKVSKPVPEKAVPKEPAFSCPICMGTLVSPCSTVCGHIFCEGCIKAAVQVKKICPTCRTKLTMKHNFHKVFLPTATAG